MRPTRQQAKRLQVIAFLFIVIITLAMRWVSRAQTNLRLLPAYKLAYNARILAVCISR